MKSEQKMSENGESQSEPIPQEKLVPGVIFLSEQDGQAERELKAQLIQLFKKNTNLQSAFLVRVRYSDSRNVDVALCLDTTRVDLELVKCVGIVFHEMFGAHEHLDVMFLTHEQKLQIVRVATPFYSQSPQV